MRTGSIYIIKNKINDKVYVGQTTMTVHERFMTHMKPSTSKKRHNYKLYMAVNKYGRENFYVETLETGIPLDQIDQKEIEYIAKYDSYYHGYNSTKGGDGRVINLIEHEEELLDMAQKGVPATELAECFDVNIATIYRTLHKLGFYYYELDEQAVLNDVLAGMLQDDIAKKYNINKMTITRLLRKNGIRVHKERIDLREDFDVESIKKDYEEQVTIDEICHKYNISKTTFYRIKQNYGFNTRRQIYTNVTMRDDIEEMHMEYESGLPVSSIAQMHDLSYNSVSRIIKAYSWERKKECRPRRDPAKKESKLNKQKQNSVCSNETLIGQIKNEFISGCSKSAISKKYDISLYKLSKLIEANNWERNEESIDIRNLQMEFCNSNIPLSDLCTKYSISESKIYYIARKNNWSRQRIYKHQQIPTELLKADYFSYFSIQELSEKYGVSTSTIKKVIKDQGWKRPTRKERINLVELKEDYEAMMPFSQLYKKYNTCETTLYKIIDENGWDRRKS